LISLYGEMIMGFAVFDRVSGEVALGEEGIGGDSFALDIDGSKQWYDGFDLIAVSGDGSYFFWVWQVLLW